MKLERMLTPQTIQQIVETVEVEIELTAEELRQAYLEEKHDNLLSDSENQFYEFVYRNFGSTISDAGQAQFVRYYGITIADVEDINSPHYLLERFVTAFEKGHDCNNADNDAWQAGIKDVLEEYSKTLKHRCPHCGYALRTSDLPEYSYLCALCDENFYEFEAVEVDQMEG